MEHLVKKSLLDLPDQAIEIILDYLSFDDLINLGKVQRRLATCVKRVSKKKPFSKYYMNYKWGKLSSSCYINIYVIEFIVIYRHSHH